MELRDACFLTRQQPHGHDTIHHTETSLQSRPFARHLLPKVKSFIRVRSARVAYHFIG